MKKKLTALLMVLTLLLAFAPVGNAFANSGTVTKTFNIVNGSYYVYFSDYIGIDPTPYQGTLTVEISDAGILESAILNYTVQGDSNTYFVSFEPFDGPGAVWQWPLTLNFYGFWTPLEMQLYGLDGVSADSIDVDGRFSYYDSTPSQPATFDLMAKSFIKHDTGEGGTFDFTGSLEEVTTPPVVPPTLDGNYTGTGTANVNTVFGAFNAPMSLVSAAIANDTLNLSFKAGTIDYTVAATKTGATADSITYGTVQGNQTWTITIDSSLNATGTIADANGDTMDFNLTLTSNSAPQTWTTIEDTNPAITWSGSDWIAYSDPQYSGGSTHYTATANASAQLTFNGTAVQWIGTKSGNRGLADVYIDGALAATVNCNSSTDQFQNVVFSVANLSPGAHTIKIVAKSNVIDVDALAYK